MKTYMANPDKIERKWYVEHEQQAQKPVELKF